MKYLISFLLILSSGSVFAQKVDPFSVREGATVSFQTTTSDLESLVAELGLTGQPQTFFKQTTCDWFTVNGSLYDGEPITFLMNGKAITVWLSYSSTWWTTCPNGNCKTYKGKWAGVTVGKYKPS